MVHVIEQLRPILNEIYSHAVNVFEAGTHRVWDLSADIDGWIDLALNFTCLFTDIRSSSHMFTH